MSSEADSQEYVTVTLWREDAIVLFAWLTTVDMALIPVSDRAELQALTDLLSALESDTTAGELDLARVNAARMQVRRDMGW